MPGGGVMSPLFQLNRPATPPTRLPCIVICPLQWLPGANSTYADPLTEYIRAHPGADQLADHFLPNSYTNTCTNTCIDHVTNHLGAHRNPYTYAEPLTEYIRAHPGADQLADHFLPNSYTITCTNSCSDHVAKHLGTHRNPNRMATTLHQRNVHNDGRCHLGPGDGMPTRRIRASLLHQNLEPGLPAVLTELPSWNVHAGGMHC